MAEGLIGTVVDEVDFDIERGKIAEFSRASATSDPVHVDRVAARATGFDDVPATPTHVVVSGHQRDQRAVLDKLGLALDRVVVGSVKWQYLRPLQGGETVRGVRRVTGDEQREGKRGGAMRLVTLETEYTDTAGTAAVRQQEVLIERGATA